MRRSILTSLFIIGVALCFPLRSSVAAEAGDDGARASRIEAVSDLTLSFGTGSSSPRFTSVLRTARAETSWIGEGLLTSYAKATAASFTQEDEMTAPPMSVPSGDLDIDYDDDGVVDRSDLQRAAQNPVAALISLPLQNNLNFDVGQLNHEQNVLNIQPVIPFQLSEDWNLITRTIVPVVYQPSLFSGDDYDFGLGDVQLTTFFSPIEPTRGWIWGAGPSMRAPTSTDARLGQRKWAAGPAVVALRMEGPWVFGALVQNVWSLAGSGSRNYSEFLVQPFVNYNLPDGWYLLSAPIITADWQRDSDERWIVPLGGGVGKIFQLGDQPVNLSAQAYYNVETPTNGPEWSVRVQVQFLFPK